MKRFVSKSRLLKSGAVFVLIGGLAGCGQSLPVDPQGTLETVHAEGLRVGLSPNGDFVNVQDDPYTGSEVELAQDFVESLGVEVTWVIGGDVLDGLGRVDDFAAQFILEFLAEPASC